MFGKGDIIVYNYKNQQRVGEIIEVNQNTYDVGEAIIPHDLAKRATQDQIDILS